MGGADGSQRLAKLQQPDFVALAQTVFEEQNCREQSFTYAFSPPPNADRMLHSFFCHRSSD